jgi:hypothetical protein
LREAENHKNSPSACQLKQTMNNQEQNSHSTLKHRDPENVYFRGDFAKAVMIPQTERSIQQ